jgi:hypothetical protein
MQGIPFSPHLIDSMVKNNRRDIERLAMQRRVRFGNWQLDRSVGQALETTSLR